MLVLTSSRRIQFLSTPSGWRATDVAIDDRHRARISIHALRVEGDVPESWQREAARNISIHALRVEGDSMSPSTTGIVPGFLSTPSGWRATDNA